MKGVAVFVTIWAHSSVQIKVSRCQVLKPVPSSWATKNVIALLWTLKISSSPRIVCLQATGSAPTLYKKLLALIMNHRGCYRDTNNDISICTLRTSTSIKWKRPFSEQGLVPLCLWPNLGQSRFEIGKLRVSLCTANSWSK